MSEKYKADFLWPYDDDSIESLGYNFANCKTEEMRKEYWKEILNRINKEAKEVPVTNDEAIKLLKEWEKHSVNAGVNNGKPLDEFSLGWRTSTFLIKVRSAPKQEQEIECPNCHDNDDLAHSPSNKRMICFKCDHRWEIKE